MSKIGLLCATSIVSGIIAIAGVNAGSSDSSVENMNTVMMFEAVQTDRVRTGVTSYDDRSGDVFRNISVQSFLETLYDAQIAMHNELYSDGRGELVKALLQLDKLIERDRNGDNRINDLDARHYSERKVIDVRFGHMLEPDQAIMPAGSAELTAHSIDGLINIDALAKGSIEEAKVRYISYNVDYKDVREQLLEAKAELDQGDYTSARFDILRIQSQILNDRDEMMIPARLQARDHIELTRFLVAEGEYAGAQQSLDIAEDALSVLSSGTDDAVAVMNMRHSVSQLRQELSQQNISLLEQIDSIIEDILSDLS